MAIELVPETCRYANLANLMAPVSWQRIRDSMVRSCDGRCEVCGVPDAGGLDALELHEVWAFDDVATLQTLTGFQPLCPACHEVKHIGLAFDRGRARAAIEHLCAVNLWTLPAALNYLDDVFIQWTLRSATEGWRADMRMAMGLGFALRSSHSQLNDIAFNAEILANKRASDPARRRLQSRTPPASLVPAHRENH